MMKAACGLTAWRAGRQAAGRRPDRARWIGLRWWRGHRQDRRARHQLARIGDSPVRTDLVDEVQLHGADGDRCAARVLRGLPHDTHLLGEVEDLVGTLDDRGLDRRDVQRQLDRLAHPDRAALVQVGIGRGVTAPEVGHDVHEHRCRGGHVILDPGQVADRLERRSRLAPAIGEHIELGLEFRPAGRGVVIGRADVGDDVPGAVVDRPQGGVVDARGP